jgi:long-chain acyl-CoA synthetase
MREFSEPARYVAGPHDNLTDDVLDNAARHGDEVGYSRRVGDAWVDVTHAAMAHEVTRLAAGLMASGIQPGDRVAIFGGTSFEWMVCDFAIWTASGVTVPIYETSSAEQVEWILGDSGATGVFVADPALAGVVAGVRPRLAGLGAVWSMERGALEELAARGANLGVDVVEARRTSVAGDSLATIVYTSGTTGRPKGCVMTHANLLGETRNVVAADNVTEVVFNEHSRTLLFIPVAHILARVIQLAAVHNRVHLAHSSDARNAATLLVDFQPTVVLAVPYIFEKIYNTAKHKATAAGKGRIFARADAAAGEYSRALDGGGPGLMLRLRHTVFGRLVYSKLRAAVGGRTEQIVSGGAPLGSRLGHFFRGVGMNPLEGYGLTETSSGVTLNVPGQQKIGSVGRPLPGWSVRIADDGEVLLKGDALFQGYWHNDAATQGVFDDEGWFHSGDLGALDDEGYLFITGRKKDLIVTAAGKNIAPAVLEDRLRAHWLVGECVVVGDRRPYVGALLSLDPEVMVQWKQERGLPEDAGVASLRERPDLLAELQRAVDDANAAVSRAESIRRFVVLDDAFSIEDGQLTSTLKVKRGSVLVRYAAEIDRLYAQERATTPQPTP